MNTAKPLTIPQASLAHIKRLAGTTRGDRAAERALYFAIALASAKHQNPEHIAGMLAEKSNFLASLAAGLKHYAEQS